MNDKIIEAIKKFFLLLLVPLSVCGFGIGLHFLTQRLAINSKFLWGLIVWIPSIVLLVAVVVFVYVVMDVGNKITRTEENENGKRKQTEE